MSETSESASSESRLRPHPTGRFASPHVYVDLQATIARLRSEPSAGERGHRQETLYKHHGYTVALFVFDRFTHLAEHKTNGIVHIHALRGCLKVTAAGEPHELRTGQMLVLASGVPHAVAAEEESEMLLSVHLGDGDA